MNTLCLRVAIERLLRLSTVFATGAIENLKEDDLNARGRSCHLSGIGLMRPELRGKALLYAQPFQLPDTH